MSEALSIPFLGNTSDSGGLSIDKLGTAAMQRINLNGSNVLGWNLTTYLPSNYDTYFMCILDFNGVNSMTDENNQSLANKIYSVYIAYNYVPTVHINEICRAQCISGNNHFASAMLIPDLKYAYMESTASIGRWRPLNTLGFDSQIQEQVHYIKADNVIFAQTASSINLSNASKYNGSMSCDIYGVKAG